MCDDELDFDGERADLEARFRELERDEQIRRMRQQGAAGPGAAAADKPPEPGGGRSEQDDLADIKAALDDDRPLERYLLVLCPGCGAKNRVSLTKLRNRLPVCGACKEDLSFTPLG